MGSSSRTRGFDLYHCSILGEQSRGSKRWAWQGIEYLHTQDEGRRASRVKPYGKYLSCVVDRLFGKGWSTALTCLGRTKERGATFHGNIAGGATKSWPNCCPDEGTINDIRWGNAGIMGEDSSLELEEKGNESENDHRYEFVKPNLFEWDTGGIYIQPEGFLSPSLHLVWSCKFVVIRLLPKGWSLIWECDAWTRR